MNKVTWHFEIDLTSEEGGYSARYDVATSISNSIINEAIKVFRLEIKEEIRKSIEFETYLRERGFIE